MRSLPNVIKSNCVYFMNNDVKIIDSNFKEDFMPISMKQVIEVTQDEEETLEQQTDEELYQMNHVQNASEELHKMQSYAQSIVEDAQREAEEIKMQAVCDAQSEIDAQMQSAKNSGYAEGIQQAQEQIQDQLRGIEEQRRQLEEEYDEKVREMQSNISELVGALVQKITGVVIEEKNIITYLICNAVKGQSACNEFRISVSKADYPEVLEHKSEIEDLLRSTAIVTIIENPELMKNQCKIETEKNIVDCGIETKLSNLSMALKLLT